VNRPPPEPGPYDQMQGPDPIVVVPYVKDMLRGETADAVAAWGGRWCMYPLDPADPYAYGQLLAGLWGRGGDLIIVEQDIVPAPGMIRDLLHCNGLWCSHWYHVGNGVYTTGLGLCKFSASLQQQLPEAGRYATVHPATGGGPVPWQGLDASIERVLSRRAVVQHIHEGKPTHLHYPESENAG
jgi:hypothetical protein